MTEQYQCKSYSDDNHVVQDCTCGKCGESWEEEFDQFVNYFGSKDRQAIRPEFHENPQAIKSFIRNLILTQSKAQDDLLKRVDMEIYALENTLEKSKELPVAVGHKRVYERIKLISEYKGKLEAWKEMKEILTPPDTTTSISKKV